MAEQDKDLPLVVAEILIELHDLNTRVERVETVLVEVVDNIRQMTATVQQLSGAMNRTAEVMLQQQENNRCYEQLREADRQQASRLERAIVSIENRFERLENN